MCLFPSVRQRWNWIPSQPGTAGKEVSRLYHWEQAQAWFPFVSFGKAVFINSPLLSSPQTPQPKKDAPTIIIFIVGGMTYSEMRAMYEVTKAFSSHEVIIGKKRSPITLRVIPLAPVSCRLLLQLFSLVVWHQLNDYIVLFPGLSARDKS